MNELDRPKLGNWVGATSESIALIANVNGQGIVLAFAGDSITKEIFYMGYDLKDNGLCGAPNGLSIWEGHADYESAEAHEWGKFRSLTHEEWAHLAKTGVPWEIGEHQ